jgi:hypothetical protein
MKNFIVGALIIGLAIVIGFVIVVNRPIQMGASSGPTHYNQEYFYGGLVQGGGINTKTAGTSTTWTATDICDYSVIKWVPVNAVNTTTLPTALAINSRCLPQDGDFKDILFWNASASSTGTTVFTTSTGITLYVASGTNAIVDGTNFVPIRFLRTATSATRMFIDKELPK